MELPSAFAEFIKEIPPTDSMRNVMISGHTTLRNRLLDDETLKPIIVATFLQGSYARKTDLRPKADKRSDVDVVVVTNIDEKDYTPLRAQNLFKPFLDKHYNGKWKRQGRSLGIELSTVDLDLVITSSPAHANAKAMEGVFGGGDDPDYRPQPLRIPNRDSKAWEDTDPLAQLQWTRAKNKRSNANFTQIVRALKWWRLESGLKDACNSLKSYPLERVIAEYCPDSANYLCDYIIATLDGVPPARPTLRDHSVEVDVDVLARVTDDDWNEFHSRCRIALEVARSAKASPKDADSHKLWRQLFGTKFPAAPSSASPYTAPTHPARPTPQRFA